MDAHKAGKETSVTVSINRYKLTPEPATEYVTAIVIFVVSSYSYWPTCTSVPSALNLNLNTTTVCVSLKALILSAYISGGNKSGSKHRPCREVLLDWEYRSATFSTLIWTKKRRED